MPFEHISRFDCHFALEPRPSRLIIGWQSVYDFGGTANRLSHKKDRRAMFMSLIRDTAAVGPFVAHVRWVPLDDMRATHPAGKIARERSADGLVFALSHTALSGSDVLACHACDVPSGRALLRVDEVCFPVGAVAHRHTHAGAGIRHLVRGRLRIEADGHVQTMQAGESWFEAADSSVRAVSLHAQGVTSFLRAMVIPAAFEGKSTFALVDPDDARLPRLQVTHRHVDLPLQVDAG